MPNDKAILPMKRVKKMAVHCSEHWKESRMEVAYIEEEKLVIVRCLDCPKGMELMRFKVAKEW